MYLYGEEIDERLNWTLGTAVRLARRKKLPHLVLPDGSIRFEWPAVEAMVRRVPAEAPGGDNDVPPSGRPAAQAC